jgi:dimethylhistidine N-methyltransferase
LLLYDCYDCGFAEYERGRYEVPDMTNALIPGRGDLTRIVDRFLLYRSPGSDRAASFADDVRAGLDADPKQLSPKYFYDDLGSAIFEAICHLPEYDLTRNEREIFDEHADEIVGALGEPIELIELGSGSGKKTRLLIEATLRLQGDLVYHPIDISAGALSASVGALLADYARLSVSAYASDYFDVLAARRIDPQRRALVLFLGSNIGNYAPVEARRLLHAIASAFKPGDALLLGADVKKAARVHEAAYDDPTGVTAAFNKNLLARINRELGGDFDLRAFDFKASYDAGRGSVESYLIAKSAQRVRIALLERDYAFAAGEPIHMESSYKFSIEDLIVLANETGFRFAQDWTDAGGRFLVCLLVRT